MQYLIFKNTTYEVDHAVKGADFIHGYDATGKVVVAFEGVTDFSVFEYDGSYLAPEDCISEPCNDLKYCAGKLQKRDGTAVTPVAIGAAPVDSVGTNKVYKKLTDIGITTFPTTMKTVANAMPNNSTLMLDSRDILSGGTNEISDLGCTNAGMYMFMRGNSNARMSLISIYGATSATTSAIRFGCYAASTDAVTWLKTFDDSDTIQIANGGTGATTAANALKNLGAAPATADSTYTSCYYRTVGGVKEWINPPMVLGTEYRTTERYKGKPVYKKVFSYTVATAVTATNTYKEVSIPHGVTNISELSSWSVHSTSSGALLPYVGGTGTTSLSRLQGNNVVIRTLNQNIVAGETYFIWLAYIKTTD